MGHLLDLRISEAPGKPYALQRNKTKEDKPMPIFTKPIIQGSWPTLSLIAILGLSTPVQAVTIFTDRPSWEAAVSGFTTESFDMPLPNSFTLNLGTGMVSTGIGESFTHLVRGGVFRAVIDSDLDESVNQPGLIDSLLWTFPNPVTGFGRLFGSSANEEGLQITGDFDGLGIETIDLANEIGNSSGILFVGDVGTSTFSDLTFQTRFGDPAGEFGSVVSESFIIDDFSFSEATQSAIPEPSPLLLVGTGLIILIDYAVKKNKLPGA